MEPPIDYLRIIAELEAMGVSCASEIATLACPSVRLLPRECPAQGLHLGASRFGGAPDVPDDFVWPATEGVPLCFLAQIDLSSVSSPLLPDSGWLLAFLRGSDEGSTDAPEEWGDWKMVHLDCDREKLRPAKPFLSNTSLGVYPQCAVDFAQSVDLPSWFDSALPEKFRERSRDGEDSFEQYLVLCNELNGRKDGDPYHHLFGYMREVNGMSADGCEGEVQYWGLEEFEKSDNPHWILLLELDSEYIHTEWQWGGRWSNLFLYPRS